MANISTRIAHVLTQSSNTLKNAKSLNYLGCKIRFR